MEKASMGTRHEIIKRQRQAYAKANKRGKGEILDMVCQATGLSRDRAGRVLREAHVSVGSVRARGAKKGRKPKYGDKEVITLLKQLWALMGYISGKRLCAGIPDMMEAMARHGELNASERAQSLIKSISPATADRLLAEERRSMEIRGRSTTKPGTLLKRDIPIRLGTQWDEERPGYMEMDLVAHCGDTTAGDYVNTLDMTDIYSGWTETAAVLNRAQVHVLGAIKHIRARLPFPLLGVDSDNGTEFINDQLYRYCRKEKLVFTRSRPYRKNDNCHVEQKNYSIVRREIGYGRYEGETAVKTLNEYYALLRLYSNYFLPSAKLIHKERHDARVYKKHDKPLTPYKRLLLCDAIADERKAAMRPQFEGLNPVTLKRDMMTLQERLQTLSLPYARSARAAT